MKVLYKEILLPRAGTHMPIFSLKLWFISMLSSKMSIKPPNKLTTQIQIMVIGL
jgi:hypothetical protein